MNRSRPPSASLWHRLTALLGLALVLALNLLAARPDWHAALHAAGDSGTAHAGCPHHGHGNAKAHPAPDSHAADDHGCVIELFAHGKAGFEAAPLAVTGVCAGALFTLSAGVVIAPRSSEHFLPPGCGPPLA